MIKYEPALYIQRFSSFRCQIIEIFLLDSHGTCNYNIIINTISFEWDEYKNSINKEKHHISFEEASTVFYDENALLIVDPDHSDNE